MDDERNKFCTINIRVPIASVKSEIQELARRFERIKKIRKLTKNEIGRENEKVMKSLVKKG